MRVVNALHTTVFCILLSDTKLRLVILEQLLLLVSPRLDELAMNVCCGVGMLLEHLAWLDDVVVSVHLSVACQAARRRLFGGRRILALLTGAGKRVVRCDGIGERLDLLFHPLVPSSHGAVEQVEKSR